MACHMAFFFFTFLRCRQLVLNELKGMADCELSQPLERASPTSLFKDFIYLFERREEREREREREREFNANPSVRFNKPVTHTAAADYSNVWIDGLMHD